MIWYRHWLELRGRILVVFLAAIVLGAWPVTPLDGENAIFTALLRAGASTRDAESLALFVSRSFVIVFGGAIALCGNGVRTWYMDHIAPSDANLPFTLTLPLARASLVGSRLMAGWVLTIVMFALVMGGLYAANAIQGRMLPVGPLAKAFGWMATGMTGWILVQGAALMTRGLWIPASFVVGIFLSLPLALSLTLAGLAGNVTGIARSAVALAVLGATAFAFTLHRVRRLEC